MAQAEHDVGHARHSLDVADYEWSCFAAQQAAEKAVKALAVSVGGEPWGHSVATLLALLPAELNVPPALIDQAKVLDKHYILPRYPNGFDTGSPFQFYTMGEAETAIKHADAILEFCRNNLH